MSLCLGDIVLEVNIMKQTWLKIGPIFVSDILRIWRPLGVEMRFASSFPTKQPRVKIKIL